jgi:hypothetical protein
MHWPPAEQQPNMQEFALHAMSAASPLLLLVPVDASASSVTPEPESSPDVGTDVVPLHRFAIVTGTAASVEAAAMT